MENFFTTVMRARKIAFTRPSPSIHSRTTSPKTIHFLAPRLRCQHRQFTVHKFRHIYGKPDSCFFVWCLEPVSQITLFGWSGDWFWCGCFWLRWCCDWQCSFRCWRCWWCFRCLGCRMDLLGSDDYIMERAIS